MDDLNKKIPDETKQEANILDRQPLLSSLDPKKKNFGMVGLALMILAAIVLFFLFSGKEKPKDGIQKEAVEFEPAAGPVILPSPPDVKVEDHSDEDELRDARMKSALVIYGGQNQAATPQRIRSGSADSYQGGSNNANSDFQNNVGSRSTPKAQASSVGSLEQTILQGKLIDAVLERDYQGAITSICCLDSSGAARWH